MAKLELTNSKEELRHLGDMARKCHQRLMDTGRDHLVYTVIWGLVMNKAKEILPHGDFGHWLAHEVPEFSNGATHRYMALAADIQTKFPIVGNLKFLQSGETTTLELKDSEVKQIEQAAHEYAGQRNITAMYRDLGLVRPPKRAGGTRRDQPQNAKATAESRTKAVDELLSTIRAYIRIATECKDLDRASVREVADTLDACVEFSALLRPLTK